MREKNNMVAFRFDLETAMLLEELAERYSMTKTQVVQSALQTFASVSRRATEQGTPKSQTAATQSQVMVPDSLSKHLEKLERTVKAIDESCYHQLNLLNSLCDNVAAPEYDTYTPADQPTAWLSKSRQGRRNNIIDDRTKKMMSGD